MWGISRVKPAWRDSSWDENCTGARWEGKMISCDLPTPSKGVRPDQYDDESFGGNNLYIPARYERQMYTLMGTGCSDHVPSCDRNFCAHGVFYICLLPSLLMSYIRHTKTKLIWGYRRRIRVYGITFFSFYCKEDEINSFKYLRHVVS